MRCFCKTHKSKKLFQSGNYKIVQCVACRQVRTEAPAKIKRKNFYGKEDIAVYIEKEEMFRRLFRNVIEFIQRFTSSGTLVDIGAGVGLLVDEANNAGFDAVGFEPSSVAVAAAKKSFGVNLINGIFSNKKFQRWIPGQARNDKNTDFDIVVINHVLEHIEDPKQFLAYVAERIKDDGFLCIGVPNFGSFMAQLKKGRWQSLIPDQHRWHFTLTALDTLVTSYGFLRVGATYENHVRSMHPWWKRLIYAVLDTIAIATGKGEAMLVAYQKV